MIAFEYIEVYEAVGMGYVDRSVASAAEMLSGVVTWAAVLCAALRGPEAGDCWRATAV